MSECPRWLCQFLWDPYVKYAEVTVVEALGQFIGQQGARQSNWVLEW